ncbi:MAG: TonB-dependent receptor [Desulfobacterales bacterium]|nr:TonB-dependent receptor [Desulfobacterales bacterium]
MKQFKMVTCLFTLVFALASIPQAQEAVELKKTVVTATRTETPVENLPISVSVITRDDIEKIHAKTVDDVLNKVAGVLIKRNKGLSNTGSHTTISMRGTANSSRVLVLKDGIPLNSTYIGSVNFWGVMSVEDIEKIEIVRGASSALYGSSAMGGVINIITRPAREKTSGSVSFEGGTFDTYIGNANIAAATDKFGLRASAGHKRTKGYEFYEDGNWLDHYKKPENELTNISLGADIWLGKSLLKLDYEYFLEDSLVAHTTKPTSTAKQYDSEAENNNYILSYSFPIGKTDVSIKSFYFDYDSGSNARKYSTTTKNYDDFDYDSDIPKDEYGLMMQVSAELGNHRLTIGSDLKWGKCDSKYTYTTYQKSYSGKQDLYSLFVNDEMLIGEKLILSAGVRYDYWKNHSARASDDKSGVIESVEYLDKTNEAWSPRAGVVYKLREKTKLRASFGTGFKAPSLYHLYKTGTHGSTRFDLANPDLGPEKMPWSYDVGFDMKPNDNLNLSFTFYQSMFKDFMGDKTLTEAEALVCGYTPEPGQLVMQKVNMGRIDIHGVEVSLEYAFNSRWSAFVNHTYNVSKIKKYEAKPEVEGNYLSYTPRHTTKIGFIYDNPDLFTLGLYITDVGSRFGDFENSDKKKLKGYHVVDMKVSRELFDGMNLFVSVDNLTDKKYKEYYTTYNPPITVMVGAKYTF